jgi:hypothetical protein
MPATADRCNATYVLRNGGWAVLTEAFMSSRKPNYRLYSVDDSYFLKSEWLEALDDEEAIAAAQAANPRSRCELWDGQRLVATFEQEILRQ